MHHIPNQQTKETFAFYSNYESDETGTYKYTIGMPVSSLEDVPANMTTLTIPAATYAVFTTRKGPVAEVVCEAWDYIWKWSKENKRAFTIDFELYDEKSNRSKQRTIGYLYCISLNDKKRRYQMVSSFLSLNSHCANPT